MGKINLLNEFFNSKSDASPLEATEQEQLEKDFQDWFDSSEFTLGKKECMPDEVNTKEEHSQYLKDIEYKGEERPA